ncbi:hypothetical protein GCM10027262_28260 [Nocardia tengchongensis]
MTGAHLVQYTRQFVLFSFPPREHPNLAHVARYLALRATDKLVNTAFPAAEIIAETIGYGHSGNDRSTDRYGDRFSPHPESVKCGRAEETLISGTAPMRLP